MDKYEAIKNSGGLIYNHVRKYTASGIDPNLLKLKAESIVAQAARDYSPEKGNFYGYADAKLKGLGRFVNSASDVYIPELRINKYSEYKKILEKEEERLGRVPSVEEFSDKAGVTTSEAKRVLQELNRKVIPLSKLDDEITIPTSSFMEDENKYIKFVYDHTKDPDEKRIMEMTFGLNNSPIYSSNSEMANIIGISETSVRRLKDKIIERVKEHNIWDV